MNVIRPRLVNHRLDCRRCVALAAAKMESVAAIAFIVAARRGDWLAHVDLRAISRWLG
jgi:hypothetical protein